MNNDFSSSITVNPAKSLHGRVKIINTREEILESNLIIIRKDHILESSINVVYNSEMDSSIVIVQSVEDEYLNASIAINAHSKLYGIIDMQPIPREYKKLTPTKDVHVREDYPTFNLGGQEVLYIGNKDGNRYRAFIGFDLIDVLPEGMTLTNAKLTLHFPSENEFKDFELSILNRDWHEYGTTWNSQPTRRSIILETDISDGIYKVVFDVKDIVQRWIDFDIPNYGFLLKRTDETEYDNKFKGIYAKESFLPPELEIEYINPTVLNPRRAMLNAGLIIIQNDDSVLNGSMEIPIYYGEGSIPANIDIFNHKMLQSSLRIKNIYFESSMLIVQNDESVIDSSIYVKGPIKPFFDSSIYVINKYLPAWIDLRKTSSLESSINVNVVEEDEAIHPASISVINPYLPAIITIRSTSQIGCSLYLYDRDWSERPAEMTITKKLLSSSIDVRQLSSIESSLLIKEKTEIESNISVRQNFGIDSSITVRYYNDLESNIAINKKALTASLFVRGRSNVNASIFVRPHFNIDSSIHVRRFDDFDASITVKQVFFSDTVGSLMIGKPERRKSYGFIM